MPFTYEFKLNKQKITGIELGFVTNRKWEEALDDAKVIFPFTTNSNPLPMYGLFEIEINEINNYTQRLPIDSKKFTYLIYSDKVSQTSKYGYYRHEVSAIEYTAKLDAYFINSLAKSRSVYRNVQAPFTVNNDINYFEGTNDSYTINATLQNINAKETYYANHEVTFAQVFQPYVVTNTGPTYYRRGEAVIKTNAPLLSGTSPHVLSSSPATWKFPTGNWEIEYGFTGDADDFNDATVKTGFQWVYKFNIRVFDEYELTMYDVLNEIRNCVSTFGGIEDTVYFDATRVFDIEPSREAYLRKVIVPQMFFDTNTARQMLIMALSFINSVPRLEWGNTNDILDYEEYNANQGSFVMKDVMEFTSQQNTTQIGQRSYSKIQQALPNTFDKPTVFTPSQSGYVQVRSTVQELTANNFGIKLLEGKPLYMPNDLISQIPEIRIIAGASIYTYTYTNQDISLMPRFINREEWLLKTITTNYPTIDTIGIWKEELGLRPNRVGNLSWQQGDTEIKLSDIYGELFGVNLLKNVVIEAIREYFVLNPPIPYIDGSGIVSTYTLEYDIPADADYMDWRFRVEYISEETLVTKQDKFDISNIDFYSELRQNQDESIVDIVRQTRKNSGALQRAGNPENAFPKLHKTLSDAYPIGTTDSNGYTITEISTQWYNEHYINVYFLTRFHNRISQMTYIDQTYRWRDNYSKTAFSRHEYYNDYLIIVPPDEPEVFDLSTKIYSNNTVKRSMDILLGNNFVGLKTKATVALVRTDGMLSVYPDTITDRNVIITPLTSYGINNGFAFTMSFKNNQIAGDALVQRTTKYFNQAVRYTDTRGRFTRFAFWILNDIEIAETDMPNYPLVSITDYNDVFSNDKQYFGCGYVSEGYASGEPLVVYKDPLTNYAQTYELKVLSYYTGLYGFGMKYFTDNFLVDNPTVDKKPYLYLYTNGTTYETFDDLFVKDGYAQKIQLTSGLATFDIDTLQYRFSGGVDLTGVTSWAIGNDNGDLYVYCNEALNGFDVKKTHIRPNVFGIGMRGFQVSIYDLEFGISSAMTFSFVRGKELPINISSSISAGLDFNFVKGKSIGVDISSTIAHSQVFTFEFGKRLPYDLSSEISSGLDFAFRKSKNIGFELISEVNHTLSFSFGIGDSSFYSLDMMGVSSGLEMEFRRSYDIGFSLSSGISNGLSITFEKQLVYFDISTMVSCGLDISYVTSINMPLTLSFGVGSGISLTFVKQEGAVGLSSSISNGLTFSFSKAIATTVAPGITNKSITAVKEWSDSTETYWNAQYPSNRTTITAVTPPNASSYAVGFALKFYYTLDPSTPYYFVATFTGNTVKWQIVNEEQGTVTIYCRVGTSGSYENYGTVADGGTSSLLSKFVSGSGSTTVYAYAQASGKAPSSVVSL